MSREQQVRRVLREMLRESVFRQGDIVRFVADRSGSALHDHDRRHGPCEYLVVDTGEDCSAWLAVTCLEHDFTTSRVYGPSYFRIVGPCSGHYPVWRTEWPPAGTPERRDEIQRLGFDPQLGWKCARCDAPTPEAMSTFHLYEGAP